MRSTIIFLLLLLSCVLPACSSEMAKRSAYESMKNKSDMDCRAQPGASCPEPQSYDEYQKELKKK
jgi:hypothetical protein